MGRGAREAPAWPGAGGRGAAAAGAERGRGGGAGSREVGPRQARRLGRRPSLPPRARRDPAPVSGEAGVRQMHTGRGRRRGGEREPTTKLGVAALTERLE